MHAPQPPRPTAYGALRRLSRPTPTCHQVHLGTNDFCCEHDLDPEAFVTSYIEMLVNLTAIADGTVTRTATSETRKDATSDNSVRSTKLGASKVAATGDVSAARPPIFAGCGPMGSPGYLPCATLLPRLIAAGAARGLEVHALDFSGLYEQDQRNVGGCNHPSAEGQRAMASIALPVVEEVLGWNAASIY